MRGHKVIEFIPWFLIVGSEGAAMFLMEENIDDGWLREEDCMRLWGDEFDRAGAGCGLA